MAWPALTANDRALNRAALHDAQELRSRYGAEAERWCEVGLHTAADSRQRKLIKRIRAALNQLPS